MNDLKIIEKIRAFPKKIFTISDLEKILSVSKKSLPTIISRLKKRGVLNQVGRGYYSVYEEIIVPENVACGIYYPSYLSLKTVLSKVGVINQIPWEIYLVTPRKTYKTKIAGVSVVYRQIKKDLFFGYYLKDKVLIAYPEKALIDLLYFSWRGIETVNFSEMDFSYLNKKRLERWGRRYPKGVREIIEKILKL